MRNIFDQYSKPENQLTHALIVALHQDRSVLLKPFLEWIGAKGIPSVDTLQLVEQQQPGVLVSGDESAADSRRGLPDACFFDGEGWALLVESKVQARFVTDQVQRHRNTARRCGFSDPQILTIVVDRSEVPAKNGVLVAEWRELYAWFRLKRTKSVWARHFTEYLEIFEAKNLAGNYNIRGTLTMFDGFQFDDDHPFHYREAKRLLRLLGDELRANQKLESLGADLEAPGRGMITVGQGGAVWDYLQFNGSESGDTFNKWPHLTFAVRPGGLGAMLNFPNQLSGGLKSMFMQVGPEQLRAVLERVERNTRPILKRVEGSAVFFELVQRHYPSRTAQPIIDARIHADLRTLARTTSAVKHQPEWLSSAYELVTQKKSNLQFGVSVRFPYESEIVRSPKISQEFVRSWVAMKPLIELGLEHVQQS